MTQARGYFDVPFAALAHRGGYLDPADRERENTLYAFGRAVEAGYRYLETDVHASADGRLLAFHDDVLDRVTDATGAIADLPFDRIRRARVAGTDQIPTLDEVLDAFGRARFNIDIKHPSAVEPLVATIRAHACQDRVCVGSFQGASIRAFRRAMPGVATAVAHSGVLAGVLTPAVLRGRRIAGDALQVPVTGRVAGVPVRVVTPRLIGAAHAGGKKVHVWTINDAEQMHRLIDWGVDGIVSDRIDVLKAVAIERGLWQ